MSKDWQFGWHVKYTPRDAPQHNQLAEQASTTIGSKGRALLVHANIPWKCHFRLYREAFKTATDLEVLVMVTVNGKHST